MRRNDWSQSIGITGRNGPDWATQAEFNRLEYRGTGTGAESLKVEAFDGYAWSTASTATFTVNQPNVAPVVTAASVAGTVTELAYNVAGANTAAYLHRQSGTISFSDANVNDTHRVTVTALGSGYRGSLTPTLTDSGGRGVVTWTYQVSDAALESMTQGQVATETFRVTITDAAGLSTYRDVAITLNGAADGPVSLTQAALTLWGTNAAAKTNIANYVPTLLSELQAKGVATTVEQQAMVLGQIAEETGRFSQFAIYEARDSSGRDIGYSAQKVWSVLQDRFSAPKLQSMGLTFANVSSAINADVKNSFEFMYLDKYRLSPIGNTTAGDGYKYRGRGFIQLTGKSNYAAAGKALGIDLVSNPDLVATDAGVSLRTTVWFLQNNTTALRALQNRDDDALTLAINGGHNGETNRIAFTNQLLNAVGLPQHPTASASSLISSVSSGNIYQPTVLTSAASSITTTTTTQTNQLASRA